MPGGGRLTALAILMLIVFAVGILVAARTRFGANVYALGGNRTSAELMGVPEGKTTIRIYMLSSFLAALAGIVFSFYTSAGYSLAATGVELDTIAAVVIGGTLLTGGVGSVGSTLAGVLLLGLIFNILNFENGLGWISLSAYWQSVIRGAFLLLVVAIQARLSVRTEETA